MIIKQRRKIQRRKKRDEANTKTQEGMNDLLTLAKQLEKKKEMNEDMYVYKGVNPSRIYRLSLRQ